jgi:3-hydroxyisobutyrate dehydrogenase
MAKVAVLGLGAMGSRMAKSLLAAGHDVRVWNLEPSAYAPLEALGASSFATAREAAAEAEFVIAMVWDDQASRFVWMNEQSGALASMRKGSVALECATLTMEHESALAAACESAGIEFVSAPMSGSLPEADARTLIFTVGATDQAFERVKPVLLAMGSKINHAGGPLDGISQKLIINGKLAIEYAFAAEMVALMKVAGMDAPKRMAIAASTAPFAPRGMREAQFMLDGNDSVRVKVVQMIKDAENQIAQADAHGVPCPMLRAATQVFRDARDKGFGEKDSVVVAQIYEQEAKANRGW